MTRREELLRDGATMLALVLTVLGLAVRYNRGRLMWSDELLGWMVVTDPSWRHAMWAWAEGADGGGLWFYVLARLWLKIFGQTAGAFRMFSAAGVAIAVVLTFWMLRRYFRWGVALFVIGLVWFSSDIVLWQMMQARFYGLLLAAVAMSCAAALWGAHRRDGGLVLLTIFLAHLLLVGTHPFGLVYSAVVILGMAVADWMEARWRPLRYGAASAGWLVLLPSLHAMRSSAAMAKPHFWTTRPTLDELGNAYSCWSLPCQVVLATVAVLFLLMLWAGWLQWPELRQSVRRPQRLLVLSVGLLGVPLCVFVRSLWGESFFVDRYLVPMVIGMSAVLSQLVTWVTDAAKRRAGWTRWGFPATGLVSFGVLVWIAGYRFPALWQYPPIGEDVQLLRALPKGMPIVVVAVDRFDQMAVYHGLEGYRLVCLLDWAGATAPDSLRGEVTAYHEMETWRKVGYEAGAIQDSERFLGTAREFVVVNEPRLPWMERRLLHNPDFNVTPLKAEGLSGGVRLWLVRRRGV